MSGFATMVQHRVAAAAENGTLARNPDRTSSRFLEAGSRALGHLTTNNRACAEDVRCKEVWDVLALAYDQGTAADHRTALTRLQSLLTNLTEEDADVAGDGRIQGFRRRLHLFLDH